jgi:hypothetical protein
LTPASFAALSSSRWRLAAHLELVDDALLDAAAGGERVAIAVPPRMGKSQSG